jgi:hypothetical protein
LRSNSISLPLKRSRSIIRIKLLEVVGDKEISSLKVSSKEVSGKEVGGKEAGSKEVSGFLADFVITLL